jgi:hypothetical protein
MSPDKIFHVVKSAAWKNAKWIALFVFILVIVILIVYFARNKKKADKHTTNCRSVSPDETINITCVVQNSQTAHSAIKTLFDNSFCPKRVKLYLLILTGEKERNTFLKLESEADVLNMLLGKSFMKTYGSQIVIKETYGGVNQGLNVYRSRLEKIAQSSNPMFCCTIEEHVLLPNNWDRDLVQQWKQLGSEPKIILTQKPTTRDAVDQSKWSIVTHQNIYKINQQNLTVPVFEPVSNYHGQLLEFIDGNQKHTQQIHWSSDFSFFHSSLWKNCSHDANNSFNLSQIKASVIHETVLNRLVDTQRTQTSHGKELYEYWQTVQYWNNGYMFVSPAQFNITSSKSINPMSLANHYYRDWVGNGKEWIHRWMNGETKQYDNWLGLKNQSSVHMWMGVNHNANESNIINKFVNQSIYQNIVEQLSLNFVTQ